MKKYIPLILLVLTALACNVAVSEVFGRNSNTDDFYDEVEYSRGLTATLFALETAIAEATQTAAAVTETPASGFVSGDAPTETPAPGDTNAYCMIYEEYVADIYSRIDAYIRAVDADDGTGHGIAVEGDQAIEAYMDRLAPVAPPEIKASADALANMSLIGLNSSQQDFPEAEPHFDLIDDYATDHCNDSFGLREE